MKNSHFASYVLSGMDYNALNTGITINIVNQPFKLSKKLHSVYKIQEKDEWVVLDEVLEINFGAERHQARLCRRFISSKNRNGKNIKAASL